jgi:hypothetical protein
MATNMTSDEFGGKFQSKTEAHRFVATDLETFIPHHKEVTSWHLKDLIAEDKK